MKIDIEYKLSYAALFSKGHCVVKYNIIYGLKHKSKKLPTHYNTGIGDHIDKNTNHCNFRIQVSSSLLSISSGESRVQDTSWLLLLFGLTLWFSEVLSLAVQMFKSQQFLMAREELIFWFPTYDGKKI